MHRATPQFWERFAKLPERIQRLARKNFELLKQNPKHPSLHFKKSWTILVSTSWPESSRFGNRGW